MENFEERYKRFVNFAGIKKIRHQEEGMIWCVKRELFKKSHQNIHGGIIADEMGCGKTYMTIGLIVCNFVPKTLIVVPLALMNQWKKSIFESTGHIPITYYGHKIKSSKSKILENNPPIVLTTYGVLANKFSKNNKSENILYGINWNRVIFDEAHHMRNSNTNKYLAGKSLKSKIKWLITGTPIQNKLKDLYTLCSIIGINKPHKQSNDLIKENILCRKKIDVGIILPPMHIHETYVQWSNKEEENLAKILLKNTHPNVGVVSEKLSTKAESKNDPDVVEISQENIDLKDDQTVCFEHNDSCGKDDESCDDKSSTSPHVECLTVYEDAREVSCKLDNYVRNILGSHYLSYYLRSRQMCICPKLLSKLEYYSYKSEISDTSVISDAIMNTNKINRLIVQVKDNLHNGNSKIIFCNFRQEIDIIMEKLKRINITDVAIYDGRVSQKQRNNILFSKPNILLMQIQTGCEGLNLQYANEVYFVGPLWNPAMEDQAIGRCYRLGQKKNTHVYKFTMDNMTDDEERLSTMDNYVRSKLDNKRSIQLSF
jgi:SNF2 family DNA or RNA helicase